MEANDETNNANEHSMVNAGRKQTSWLFTKVAEEFNSVGATENNTS